MATHDAAIATAEHHESDPRTRRRPFQIIGGLLVIGGFAFALGGMNQGYAAAIDGFAMLVVASVLIR